MNCTTSQNRGRFTRITPFCLFFWKWRAKVHNSANVCCEYLQLMQYQSGHWERDVSLPAWMFTPPSRIPYCEGLGWAKDFALELLSRFRHVLLVMKVIRSIIKQMLCTWKQEANVEAKGVDLGKGLCPCLNLVNTTWNYNEITGIVVWHMYRVENSSCCTFLVVQRIARITKWQVRQINHKCALL